MNGIIGKKIGMTSIFNEAGKMIACTAVEVGPCVVTQVKTEEKDGYNAIQIGYGEKKEKNTTKALKGHFENANTSPKAKLVEFRQKNQTSISLGDLVSIDIFNVGDSVDVVGTSKGKGFQGVVKRHGFSGVGMATHGQHNRLRAPGSIGACSTPSRVFKGIKMGGRMGSDRVTEKGRKIVKIFGEENILLIKGSVPGAKGSYIIIEK